MSSIIKRLSAVFAVTVLVMSAAYLWLVWKNNRNVPPPDRQEIQASLDGAIRWLEHKRNRILQTDNPMLWWMVQRSANLTGDARLKALFDAYHERYAQGGQKGNYWRLLFRENGWEPVRYEQIEDLDDYQQLFVYAITCDSELAEVPLIRAQLDPSYCDAFPFRSSCVTHQILGLHLLQERHCRGAESLGESIHALQLRVRNQLVWDPRLRDQYIQRVLVLLETEAADMVKPVWLQRIAGDVQQDGGWSPSQVVLDLPGGNDIIFTRNFIGLGQARSSFHATAQGLLIMAHLLEKP
jgi:hypothetical protein